MNNKSRQNKIVSKYYSLMARYELAGEIHINVKKNQFLKLNTLLEEYYDDILEFSLSFVDKYKIELFFNEIIDGSLNFDLEEQKCEKSVSENINIEEFENSTFINEIGENTCIEPSVNNNSINNLRQALLTDGVIEFSAEQGNIENNTEQQIEKFGIDSPSIFCAKDSSAHENINMNKNRVLPSQTESVDVNQNVIVYKGNAEKIIEPEANLNVKTAPKNSRSDPQSPLLKKKIKWKKALPQHLPHIPNIPEMPKKIVDISLFQYYERNLENLPLKSDKFNEILKIVSTKNLSLGTLDFNSRIQNKLNRIQNIGNNKSSNALNSGILCPLSFSDIARFNLSSSQHITASSSQNIRRRDSTVLSQNPIILPSVLEETMNPRNTIEILPLQELAPMDIENNLIELENIRSEHLFNESNLTIADPRTDINSLQQIIQRDQIQIQDPCSDTNNINMITTQNINVISTNNFYSLRARAAEEDLLNLENPRYYESPEAKKHRKRKRKLQKGILPGNIESSGKTNPCNEQGTLNTDIQPSSNIPDVQCQIDDVAICELQKETNQMQLTEQMENTTINDIQAGFVSRFRNFQKLFLQSNPQNYCTLTKFEKSSISSPANLRFFDLFNYCTKTVQNLIQRDNSDTYGRAKIRRLTDYQILEIFNASDLQNSSKTGLSLFKYFKNLNDKQICINNNTISSKTNITLNESNSKTLSTEESTNAIIAADKNDIFKNKSASSITSKKCYGKSLFSSIS